jgi:hypothetical protein
MPGAASGLSRDITLIRRRAWLFIPFFVIGLVLALFIGRVAGQANAVASMQLETVVQDLVLGGDRGLRIFEAQAFTSDEAFKAKVRARLNDPNFDYARFNVTLSPISIADGVSKGVLTVSITDDNIVEAERLRTIWVEEFTKEYVTAEGLFRTRFVEKKQEVADLNEQLYQDAVEELKPMAAARGVPLDELLRLRGNQGTIVEAYNRSEGEMTAELAQINATLGNPALINGVQASIILGVSVPDGGAEAALRGRQTVLTGAIAELVTRRFALSDAALGLEFVAALDNARSLADIKNESYVRLNNARVAVTSAQSTIDTSYSSSGGVSGTLLGRVAVVTAVTLVFGLIAIYLWEWLSQVRAKSEPV